MTETKFNNALKLKNKIKAINELKIWILSEDKIDLLKHYTEIDVKCIRQELLSILYKIHDELQEEFDKL